jgi:hypothetical protein
MSAGTLVPATSFGVTIGAMVGEAVSGAPVGVPRARPVVSPRCSSPAIAAVAAQ